MSALPLPEYDGLPVSSLQHRIRSLTADDIERLLTYEREHANRAQACTVLQARLAEVREGAAPSGGNPGGARPEVNEAPPGGSRVSPQTSGPPINPPSQGVPSNPAQPRT